MSGSVAKSADGMTMGSGWPGWSLPAPREYSGTLETVYSVSNTPDLRY